MTSDLDQIKEKLEKLENKARNIDEVYGHRQIPEDTPLKITELNFTSESIAAGNQDLIAAIKNYIKLRIKDQRQDLLMFNQMILAGIKNPAEKYRIVERFGGNTTVQDVYTEGAFEIKALISQYKLMLKALKKL